MTCWTEIFATEERQKVLDENSIRYAVDQDFNLGFSSHKELEKAVKLLKAALVL